jgi:hypothetical protein
MKNVLGEKNLSIAFERWNVLKALSMKTECVRTATLGYPGFRTALTHILKSAFRSIMSNILKVAGK